MPASEAEIREWMESNDFIYCEMMSASISIKDCLANQKLAGMAKRGGGRIKGGNTFMMKSELAERAFIVCGRCERSSVKYKCPKYFDFIMRNHVPHDLELPGMDLRI